MLVDISEDTNVDPTYYIVPTSVIDRWLKDNFDAWITTPVAEGQQRAKDNRQRIIHIDGNSTRLSYGYRQKMIPYKGAWDTLGLGSTQGRFRSSAPRHVEAIDWVLSNRRDCTRVVSQISTLCVCSGQSA